MYELFITYRLINHCSVFEVDQLKSRIYSYCIEMQKEGNTSPYLLSTIIDLDKDEGLKNKDVSKLENAIQVSLPLAEFHWLNRIFLY